MHFFMRFTICVSSWISSYLVELFHTSLYICLNDLLIYSVLCYECTKPNQCYFHIHIFYNKNTTSNVVSCKYSWEFRIIEGYSYSTFNVKMFRGISWVSMCGFWCRLFFYLCTRVFEETFARTFVNYYFQLFSKLKTINYELRVFFLKISYSIWIIFHLVWNY